MIRIIQDCFRHTRNYDSRFMYTRFVIDSSTGPFFLLNTDHFAFIDANDPPEQSKAGK
jgi:hypothetical protein